MGKSLKFPTVESLQLAIQAYFDDIESKTYTDNHGVKHYEPLTITGLALALDTTRETLMDYQERDNYSDTVKRAKTVIENFAEKKIFGNNPTGAIFALKNYGWRDKIENENTNRELPAVDATQAILSKLPQALLEDVLAALSVTDGDKEGE